MTFHLYFRNGALDRGTNDGVQAGRIAAAGADPDAADIRHCTVMVKALLVMPLRLAVTLVVAPEVAVESTAPLPPVMVAITAVLVLVQVTRLVMSCCCALPLKVPSAVKITVCPAAGFGVVVLMAIAVSGPVFTVIVEVA